MKTEQAIKYFEREIRFCERAPAGNIAQTDDWVMALEANRAALAALREKQERENPKPLTLDELTHIALNHGEYGRHIWVEEIADRDVMAAVTDLCDGEVCALWGINQAWRGRDYGKTWRAYLYKPSEVQIDENHG